MLSDFLLCNRIQENPYWKMEYLTQLQKLGMITGDFLTTEYGLGIINNSDASLQKEAFQIANLAVYDGDNELGWNDLLLYKLLTLEHSSVTGEQELSTLEIYRMMVFDETMLEYADTLLGKILSVFFLELEDDPRLSNLCMQSDWILIEQDGKYELQILNKEQNMVHSFQVE